MIRFIALGTSATFPTEKRNHPGYFFEYKGIGFLLDVGENTQRQMRIAKISPKNVDFVFISHWHGDHVLGLPGLLFNFVNSKYSKTLKVIIHKRYKGKIEKVIETFDVPLNFEIEILYINKRETLEFKDFYIEIGELKHSINTLYFKFIEKDYWRLDLNLLKKCNLYKKISLIKELKEKGYTLVGNRRINIEDVGYLRKGFTFTYITDTVFFKDLYKIAFESDILLIESTYFGNKNLAKEHMHLDFDEAYDVFLKSNSKIMLVTHISQRYDKEIEKIEKIIKKKEKSNYIHILNDFDKFSFQKDTIELNIKDRLYIYKRDPKTKYINLIS